MKIVLAFDSFKECMTASEACHTAAMAIHEVLPFADIVECPLSDGGEGLVECVEEILPTERIHLKAHNPLMKIIDTSYVIIKLPLKDSPQEHLPSFGEVGGSCSIMEMAACAGLTLVPEDKRNPMLTTTYGVGEMIIDALEHGCTQIVMGIGGSATCDGGKGMIKCLKEHDLLQTNSGRIKPSCFPPLWGRSGGGLTIASDVTNPLYGPNGAAYVFAPQKGATPEQVELLDYQLRDFASETESLGLATPQLAMHPGAGAAGGLGYALMAYLGAEMKSGIDIILDIKNFDSIIRNADLVITGEGKSDSQTLMGKVPYGVWRRCKRSIDGKDDRESREDKAHKDIPVWLLSGAIDDSNNHLSSHFSIVKSINEGDSRPLHTLIQPDIAKENLTITIEDCMRAFLL